jgi:DNA-binding CsgD family transcriptional regulator
VHLAGFSPYVPFRDDSRLAAGVHDPIWARALAVRDAAAGRSQIPVDMVRRALESVRDAPARSGESPSSLLTARERDVLRLFAKGNSYAQVAGIIGNSPITVRNTIYRIEQKLGLTTKQEIVVWAVRHGLLDDDEPA